MNFPLCHSQRLRQWPDRWWNAWIMQTSCQTASINAQPPRAKAWWAEAARIDESPQVTELTISSGSDPTPSCREMISRKSFLSEKMLKAFIWNRLELRFQWDFHEHSKQPHEILWAVVPEENVYVLLWGIIRLSQKVFRCRGDRKNAKD